MGQAADTPPCRGGTSIGAFVVISPNRSTVAVVGAPLDISWSYTSLVKSVPTSIDIFLAYLNPAVSGLSFTIPVLSNISSASNSTVWTVSALNDGQYEMRIGISHRDPLLNSSACLQNGEAYGASSTAFKLTNAVAFPKPGIDQFGPLTTSTSSAVSVQGVPWWLWILVWSVARI
ncbi:hypothetical protein HDV03_003023 [Kappamyces sp. JEL0829]|nr:hypothetical protein HDV03_003023 [Kappamyces sp. JEL0829]KAJ3359030.1 hypothetical protein HDU91_005023 [Kappamyces sp. JEL0680]